MLPAQVHQLIERLPRGADVVFDADGTLWRGDVGEDFLRFATHRRFFTASYAHYEALLHESAPRAYAWAVEVMKGLDAVELQRTCDEFFATRFRGRVFPFVRPLLAALAARDSRVWICSASPRWTVLPGAAALGIAADRVIGVSCALEAGRLSGVVEQPVPVGPGKVTWLERHGVRPALGVGNGDFDVDMLAFAAAALVISPPDSENQLVRHARAQGWPILTA